MKQKKERENKEVIDDRMDCEKYLSKNYGQLLTKFHNVSPISFKNRVLENYAYF